MKELLQEVYATTKKISGVDPSKPGNLKAVLVDDDVLGSFADCFQVGGNRQVFSSGLEIFVGQDAEGIQHLFQPAGAAAAVVVFGMAVVFALIAAADVQEAIVGPAGTEGSLLKRRNGYRHAAGKTRALDLAVGPEAQLAPIR